MSSREIDPHGARVAAVSSLSCPDSLVTGPGSAITLAYSSLRTRTRITALVYAYASPRCQFSLRARTCEIPAGNLEPGNRAARGLWLPPFGRVAGWLRISPLGLFCAAVLVGGGAGLGAVGFRWLIYSVTWLATGHEQFGQQGRVGSLHFPWLGIGFLVLIPVAGGLLYGPLIYRFAREARGHGVPEVMIAVTEQDGKIRPQVSVVKALASALCIGAGGSVGREGPIVQIGSALASSLGLLARMPGPKLRSWSPAGPRPASAQPSTRRSPASCSA